MDPMQLLFQRCYSDPTFIDQMYVNLGGNLEPFLNGEGIPITQPQVGELEQFLSAQDPFQRAGLRFMFRANCLNQIGVNNVYLSGTLPPPWSQTEAFTAWVDTL
ncbi:MAG: hypothetical protein HY962_12600 [Ignavibacteriae bacterium]|nr:hypothetical protein [Ignavibacteriota bacterium]